MLVAHSKMLLLCLICGDELCNKKSNLEIHVARKHAPFGKYTSAGPQETV